jgi:O-antigen ligase
MLLCIPIFVAISHGWLINKNKESIIEVWLKWTIPCSLLISLVIRIYFPATNWGNYKTTYFVDPLTFSSYTLLFTFLSIIGLLSFYKKNIFLYKYLIISAIITGFYLSSSSGARTGWLNFPFFIFFWWYFQLNTLTLRERFIAIFSLIATLIIILFINNGMIDKIRLGVVQLINYQFNSINEDTSVAMRLSFYRMGISYFFERPISGWGDLSWMSEMNKAQFMSYATEGTRIAPRHGFHNEIITSSVRSGIWGLFSILLFFVFISLNAFKDIKLYMTDERLKLISLSLLVIIVHLFFAGLTTEILNLTFLSSFIGITIALFIGEKLYIKNNLNSTN